MPIGRAGSTRRSLLRARLVHARDHRLGGTRRLGELGIAMDMSVQLRTSGGTLCTLSLSFNDDGPLGSVFRYRRQRHLRRASR